MGKGMRPRRPPSSIPSPEQPGEFIAEQREEEGKDGPKKNRGVFSPACFHAKSQSLFGPPKKLGLFLCALRGERVSPLGIGSAIALRCFSSAHGEMAEWPGAPVLKPGSRASGAGNPSLRIRIMAFVCVRYCPVCRRTCVGCPEDWRKRLETHSAGRVTATRHGIPWHAAHLEETENMLLARRRETYLKSSAERRWSKKPTGNLAAFSRPLPGWGMFICCLALSFSRQGPSWLGPKAGTVSPM